ncbi:hypothetical protein SUGI_0620900 [Cryptomeria japonica]|uniref:wax ester synthase/diacylglycerol acyltransferase 11 n=1 Tax=Cryptomeria japonica TaxID=3369 RepID=UPI0024149443|nr:wax ester synthase/diacylglycerol acyltransferase 11 [Cryptomeria japonica]GLJ31036.1 hypothetical protein SUGI_0620900 [Cryptomeria japonica]
MEAKLVNSNGGEAVSPLGQTFSTSLFSVCIQAIFEMEQPIDVLSAKKAINDILLPCNPRFCCIMSEDRHGTPQWVQTEVNVDDHVIVPEFPPGQTEYDEFVNDYICNIHLTPLPKNRPLWEFHFLNYNTSKARATLIINMHHSLGDGTSLMSLVFCCVTRADDPNLPLTFPSSKSVPHKASPPYYSLSSAKFMYYMLQRLFVLVLVLWYTVSDVIGSLLRINWVDDSKLAIRGPPGVEMLPKVMTHLIFPMEDVRKIKNSIGGTVNDVIMGVIFCGFQRYLQITHSRGGNEKVRVTGIVPMNTRVLSGLKDIKDMIKPKSGAPWGNRFGLLHIPMRTANTESPLDSVRRARKVLDRKKMSLEVFITSRLLRYLGRQASAICMYNTLANSTLTVSNLIGPMEKIAMNQIPVKNMFFSISGLPQTLLLTVVSYMGSVRLEVIGVKGYVNCDSLAKCFGDCFEEMKDAIDA